MMIQRNAHPSLLALFVLVIVSIACNKPKYKACFTTAQNSYAVNDTIWFYNCSDFDGSQTTTGLWNFNDGSSSILPSAGLDTVRYIYTTPGTKQIVLTIGEKENVSSAEKTLVIQ